MRIEIRIDCYLRPKINSRFSPLLSLSFQLIDQLDDALKFSITVEGKMDLDDITNYDEVKDEIQSMLEVIRDAPNRTDKPIPSSCRTSCLACCNRR